MLETLLALAVSTIINIQSIDIDIPMIEGYATAYCVSGTMASGQQTRPGVCAAKKEWLGKKAYIYQRLPDNTRGELLGVYDILDTGGTQGLKNGKVIDVWMPDLQGCQDFMDYVYEDGCKGRIYILIKED